MRAEVQTLEKALAEVLAARQRLDVLGDQIRESLAIVRQTAIEAERAETAKQAAAERKSAESAENAQLIANVLGALLEGGTTFVRSFYQRQGAGTEQTPDRPPEATASSSAEPPASSAEPPANSAEPPASSAEPPANSAEPPPVLPEQLQRKLDEVLEDYFQSQLQIHAHIRKKQEKK